MDAKLYCCAYKENREKLPNREKFFYKYTDYLYPKGRQQLENAIQSANMSIPSQ